EFWQLPDITYTQNGDSLQANEPEILGKPISKYGEFIIDKVACFIEETLIHCFQKRLPSGISIIEIPKNLRKREMPMRFRIAFVASEKHKWLLNFDELTF